MILSEYKWFLIWLFVLCVLSLNYGKFSSCSNTISEVDRDNLQRLDMLRTGCQKWKKRLQIASQTCPVVKQGGNATEPCPIFLMPEYKFAHCFLSKTGSTTWFRLLQNITTANPDKSTTFSNRNVLKNQYKVKSLDKMKSVFSFITVRNPLERFLSAFRYHRMRMTEHMKTANFSVQQAEDGKATFEEFVPYFLSVGAMNIPDIHFRPMWLRCDPCHLHLDFIGHMETFDRDTSYIIDKLKLPVPADVEMKLNVNSETAGISDIAAKNWDYKYITKKQVRGLFEEYRLDAELFGYSIEPFLSMAKEDY